MKISLHPFATFSLLLASTACGHTADSQKHELTAPEHQAVAATEEQRAAHHAARSAVQDDANVKEGRVECSPGQGRVCWTENEASAKFHREAALKHRERASQHRAASRALVDAELRACAGLSEDDRDMSPFIHGADIKSVAPLQVEETTVGKQTVTRDVGATVVFRAAPGLTEEWLQRIVNCHLARNAAVEHEMPEMAYCPLVPRGAEASVRSVGDGFAVDVRANDPKIAAEILRRARSIDPNLTEANLATAASR